MRRKVWVPQGRVSGTAMLAVGPLIHALGSATRVGHVRVVGAGRGCGRGQHDDRLASTSQRFGAQGAHQSERADGQQECRQMAAETVPLRARKRAFGNSLNLGQAGSAWLAVAKMPSSSIPS